MATTNSYSYGSKPKHAAPIARIKPRRTGASDTRIGPFCKDRYFESVLLFKVGHLSVQYAPIRKKQSFVWGNRHDLTKCN